MLACPSIVSIFVAISLLLYAWNYFSRTVIDSVTHFTHMHVDLFTEYFLHFCMHCQSLPLSLSIVMHPLSYFLSVAHWRVEPTLVQTLPSLRQHCTIWERKAISSYPEMHISTQALSFRSILCFLEGLLLLAQKIMQCSHWAWNHFQLRLCIAQFQ